MADLISREALLRKMLDPIYTWEDYDEMENLVSCLPAVDAVEVVRCKDCKWGVESDFYKSYKCTIDAEYDENVGEYIGFVEWHRADFYCAYGNRREENG